MINFSLLNYLIDCCAYLCTLCVQVMAQSSNGALRVNLADGMQATPVELLRHRQHDEYLVRWNITSVNGGTLSPSSTVDPGVKSESILMWMSKEEVRACCPALLWKSKSDEGRTQGKSDGLSRQNSCELDLEKGVFASMKTDIQQLVDRAQLLLRRSTQPVTTLSISYIIHVLSAYASIGSLAGVFKETGALDLLMELLGNNEGAIRSSAGRMLRALASHDAGSRAYVLLALSQQDGIEQRMDFDSCYTLLELFAETTSSVEHGMSFDGIQLPQIPGRLLFSLVKRYLCATKLMDSLSGSGQGNSEESGVTGSFTDRQRKQHEFEFAMVMANLIVDLVKVLGWDRDCQSNSFDENKDPQSIVQSAFTPEKNVLEPGLQQSSTHEASFKSPEDFTSPLAYIEYIQKILQPGMRVRMLQDYEEVCSGDEGKFVHSNAGYPPVQVDWDSIQRRYWVNWNMIQVIGYGADSHPPRRVSQKLTPTLHRSTISTGGRLKSLGSGKSGVVNHSLGNFYASGSIGDVHEEMGPVKSEWWELLFFLKKLEGKQQQEACDIIQTAINVEVDSLDDCALDILHPSTDLIVRLLVFLLKICPTFHRDIISSRVFKKNGSKIRDVDATLCLLCRPKESLTSIRAAFQQSCSKKPKTDEHLDALLAHHLPLGKEQRKDVVTSCSFQEVNGVPTMKEEPGSIEDQEEKQRQLNIIMKAGHKTFLEKAKDIWEAMRQEPDCMALQVVGLKSMSSMLQDSPIPDDSIDLRESYMRSLVEEMNTFEREKEVVYACLLLIESTFEEFDYREAFIMENGISTLLQCVQKNAHFPSIQHQGLKVLKVTTHADEFDVPPKSSSFWLYKDLVHRTFMALSSDTPDGLLAAIPQTMQRMLDTPGCVGAVENGLLILLMLIKDNRTMAERLLHCGTLQILFTCVRDTTPSMQHACTLATMALLNLSHLGLADSNSLQEDEGENLKELELKVLLTRLQLGAFGKDQAMALERLVKQEGGVLPPAMLEPDVFRSLAQAMRILPAERLAQLALARVLSKYLLSETYSWHECIESIHIAMRNNVPEQEATQEYVNLLHRLATHDKDYAIMMCQLGTRDALTRALDKHGPGLLLANDLRDTINDCERFVVLYKQLTSSILAGCIQMVLCQIEEARRSHKAIHIPFFDIFLHILCRGSKVELHEDKCWEKVEVSSNPHRLGKIFDGNPRTYWESNGSSGSHFINIHIVRGIIVRKLTLLVASEDSSYMPSRVVVTAGEDSENLGTELSTVNISSSASRVVLVENLTRFWPVIQIRIKRCQQGGIDTRVRGFEILGPKPTFWPVFRDQLCRRTFLFYKMKAHTWTQNIDEDKTLQLYLKLSTVMRHEQQFAQRFLPDVEAAHALDQTCWEALAVPIIKKITGVESGKNLLSKLLQGYIRSSEEGMRCRHRFGLFRSRVRRLCRLLVHMDLTSSNIELKAPSKPDLKTGKGKVKSKDGGKESKPLQTSPSTALLATCWGDVAQRQVMEFMEKNCSRGDPAELYCTCFTQLCNDMQELFAGHAAFALALHDGFKAVLLRFSHVRAIKVAEMFVQAIDQRIRSMYNERLSCVQLDQLSFLEPLTFLSGLDMAITFEHYYRLYLSERLLTMDCMFLESLIAIQLQDCFPARLPLAMLKDVSNSKKSTSDFMQYCLEKVDCCLAESEEIVMDIEEQECNLHGWEGFSVIVASPSVWAFPKESKMATSSISKLPPVLKDFVQEYYNFHSMAQYHLSSHQQAKKLQWTWLGHGELITNKGLVLRVSTLQMIILLHFNDLNDSKLSLDDFLQSSGISPTLFVPHLQMLVDESKILVCKKSKGEGTKGVLQLNEAVLERLERQRQNMSLLPPHLSSHSGTVLAHMLERKKQIISCAVMRILKAEKHMHIDKLVFKVIEACQKGNTGSGRPSLPLLCCAMDVNTCVVQMQQQGYVGRRDDSPHIVLYRPNEGIMPGRRHAYTDWRGLELAREMRATSSPAHDTTENEAYQCHSEVLLGSGVPAEGRTLSPDDLRNMMEENVLLVAHTLDLEKDVAKHLLLHCQWDRDLVVHRYSEEADDILREAGLLVKTAAGTGVSPTELCPICLTNPASIAPLSCRHACCQTCWKEYLTTRIEQNRIVRCGCPISDCQAQHTTDVILSLIDGDKEALDMYNNAMLRCYVESCTNLTWCTNPQGCDRVLCKDGLGDLGTCAKCHWSSCFSCNFLEAHYPASCSHMSQWMDDGGFYEGMTLEALSKHVAKLISKRCPSCQTQIEKNEGCLHMTCGNCNYGFCWRCLKPWKPTHNDYYNCSAQVSKAAKQEKKFHDANELCVYYHKAREFAMKLVSKTATINESLPLSSVLFVTNACKMLMQAWKVLAYSCVYSYYSHDVDKMRCLELQTEHLELIANELQQLLEGSLLRNSDLAGGIRLLKAHHLEDGPKLMHHLQDRLLAILQASAQDFRIGVQANGDVLEQQDENEKKMNSTNCRPGSNGMEERETCESDATWTAECEYEEESEDDSEDGDDDDDDDDDDHDGEDPNVSYLDEDEV
uniref:Cullin 9 n=1 Tax=Eptatretus burgeri TaxID=7764 RepID=A0A8C4N4K8_EPTBU